MMPIDELLGAGVLTLSAVGLIMFVTTLYYYVRHTGKEAETTAATEQQQAKNVAALIKVQVAQTRIQQQNARLIRYTAKRTHTNTYLLRKTIKQLEALTAEQKLNNGNASKLGKLITDIKTYIER